MTYMANSNDYEVDICLCIDKTGSMRPILNTVKENALRLHSDITNNMAEKGKMVTRLRVRIVAFGDYGADGDDAFLVTDFFELPAQEGDFRDCINYVKARGGGDIPEDGLEAMAWGIRSHWNNEGTSKKRHILCLFTDAPTHELGTTGGSAGYPSNMPKSFDELTMMWGIEQIPGEMDAYAKRLLLFAPDEGRWHDIRTQWDNVVMRPAALATGLEDLSYQEMLDTIQNSI